MGPLPNTSTIFGTIDPSKLSEVSILIGSDSTSPSFHLDWNIFSKNFTTFGQIQQYKKREVFYVTAIKNLRKKINFISLNNDFQNGEINEEEFESEIENHPEKYIVNVINADKVNDIGILYEVIDNIREGFNEDEIAEIFSVDVSGKNYNIEKVK